jgi:quinol monooxygenase YgiN
VVVSSWSSLSVGEHEFSKIPTIQQKSAQARFGSAVYSKLSAGPQRQQAGHLINRLCLQVGTNSIQEGKSMEAIGLLVTLQARAGKEADAEKFLKSAQVLALNEQGTLKWYAIKLGPGRFGIFDTFANEAGRNTHLTGEIAKALTALAVDICTGSAEM